MNIQFHYDILQTQSEDLSVYSEQYRKGFILLKSIRQPQHLVTSKSDCPVFYLSFLRCKTNAKPDTS